MCLYPVLINDPNNKSSLTKHKIKVKCGKCFECLQLNSIEWSFRIMHEASFYDKNCFITLTYSDEHLPPDASISRREMQLFMKRLRKAVPDKIRFFCCGEYGKLHKRPHYHLIIFNWFPDDAKFFSSDNGSVLYRSELLERVWTFGFSSVGELTLDSARYCSKYMQKLQFSQDDYESEGLYPPFVQMSNRPGIGFNFVSNVDLVSDRVYINGKSCKVPKYYLHVLERQGVDLTDFKSLRLSDGQKKEAFRDIKQRRLLAAEFVQSVQIFKK